MEILQHIMITVVCKHNLTRTISVRLKDGMPAAHNDRSLEETEQQKQEGLQPGELFIR